MHSWEWSGDRLPFPCWEIIAFKVRGKEFSLFLLLYEWCQTLISSGYNVLSFKYDVLINANCIMVFVVDDGSVKMTFFLNCWAYKLSICMNHTNYQFVYFEEKKICTSSSLATKNHWTSPYIRKQHVYITGDNKHSQKNANGSKLH